MEQRKEHYYNLGKQLYENAEYRAAVKQLKNSLAFNDRFFEALYLLGLCYRELGQKENAMIAFKNASNQQPDNLEVRFELAKIIFMRKGYLAARFQANAILTLDRHYKKAKLIVLDADIKSRQNPLVESASSDIDVLFNKGWQDPQLYRFAAEIKILRGKLPEAEQLLDQCSKEDPGLIAAWEFLAESYKGEFQYNRVMGIYKKIIEQAEQKQPYQQAFVGFLHEIGEVEKEEALLKEMVKSYPDNLTLKLQLVNFFIDNGKFDEASAALIAEIDKKQDDLMLQKMLISLYEKQGNLDKAIEVAQKVYASIEAGSYKRVEMQNIIALLYYKRGNYSFSRTLVDSVLKQNPRDVEAHFTLCKLQMKEGNYVDAISRLRDLSVNNPDESATYYYYLGLAHELNGEHIMAEKALANALDKSPGHKEALLKLIGILEEKGFASAVEHRLQEYLRVKPKDEDIQALLKSIQ